MARRRRRRRYPEGRAGGDDEGEVVLAVALDPKHKVIKIVFEHPVAWLGLPLKEAEGFRDLLNKKIEELKKL